MTNFLQKLKMRSHNILYAAFAPLAEYKETKLEGLFKDDASLVGYLNTLFKFAIIIGAILAVLRLLYAGYMYMGNDIWTTKEKAKEIFRDVFLGLFLLLSIFIILYQINPNLLNLDVKLAPITPAEVAGPPAPSYSVLPTEQKAADAIFEDEQGVRNLLKAGGVTVYNNPCRAVGERKCTNVGLLGGNAIGGLKSLKANCRCAVVVTGGTEFWNHTENTQHQPGKSVVDLDRNSVLDAYIMQNGVRSTTDTFIRNRTIEVYRFSSGTYCKEDDKHWHVVY